MKNILFFVSSVNPNNGGVSRVTYSLVKEFQKNGYQCFYIFFYTDSDIISSDKKMRISLKTSEATLKKGILNFIETNKIDIIISQGLFNKKFRSIYRIIRKLHPDIKFLSVFHASPDYWQMELKFKMKFRSGYYTYLLKQSIKKIIYPFYNPYLIRIHGMREITDKMVLLSNRFKEDFEKIYSFDNSKLTAIPNPLSYNTFFSMDKYGEKEKIILVVTRLNEMQKRISHILNIWSKIWFSYPEWRLVIVGYGPDLENYKRMVDTLKLQNLSFEGRSDSPEIYYQKASIFLMTSIWEGFAMTLLEALQYGCIPIAYDTFSAIHDIINGNNGFIIPDNEMDIYIEKLKLLLDDYQLRENMARNAVESAHSFASDNIARQWITLFNSL